jgi:ADP-heptose:LPS heptosyltransferase
MGIGRYIAFLLALRRRNFDIVLDYLGNPRTALISLVTGAPQRFGYDYRIRKYCYTNVVERNRGPVYAVDFKMDLIKSLQVKKQGMELTLVIPSEAWKRAREFIKGLPKDGPLIVFSLRSMSLDCGASPGKIPRQMRWRSGFLRHGELNRKMHASGEGFVHVLTQVSSQDDYSVIFLHPL